MAPRGKATLNTHLSRPMGPMSWPLQLFLFLLPHCCDLFSFTHHSYCSQHLQYASETRRKLSSAGTFSHLSSEVFVGHSSDDRPVAPCNMWNQKLVSNSLVQRVTHTHTHTPRAHICCLDRSKAWAEIVTHTSYSLNMYYRGY